MRFFPIITAIAASVVLFFVVFQRDTVLRIAGYGPGDTAAETAGGSDAADGTGEVAADTPRADTIAEVAAAAPAAPPVAVIATESAAREIDSAVVLRGRTEAARTLDLLAETGGKVVSEPMLKGAAVTAGDVLCEIDMGTREATLAEARARLAEAEANLPTAAARVAEAEAARASARLDLDNAETLAAEGYAAQTRVLQARAALASAEAAHGKVLDALGKEPLLRLGMRLGEGSGAALAIGVLKGAVACHSGMATFAEAGVSDG